jgi:hypothetical protein
MVFRSSSKHSRQCFACLTLLITCTTAHNRLARVLVKRTVLMTLVNTSLLYLVHFKAPANKGMIVPSLTSADELSKMKVRSSDPPPR